MSFDNKAIMSHRKRHAKTPQQSIGFLHLVLTILTTSIIVFVLRRSDVSLFKNPGFTLVKREQAPSVHRFSEADLTRLQVMLNEQPDNEDIPKAIRALKVNLFQQWLQANDNDSIRLDSRSIDHKGLYASKRLRTGQIVARIALDRILTIDAIMKSEIGQRLATLNPSIHVAMGTYIALQRYNASSEIYSYLRILPEDISFMPVMADESALESLTGTSAWKLIVQRKVEIDNEWIRVSPIFPELTASDFLWGVLVSTTRTAGMTINGSKTAGLIPLLNDFSLYLHEFLRHAPPPISTTTARIVNGYYIVSTTKAVEEGAELTRNYGARSAQVFYCDYADVPSAITTADSIRVEFTPQKFAVPEIEDVIGAWPRSFLLTAELSHPVVDQILSYLRISVATEAEWKQAQSLTENMSRISFINDENEKRAHAELTSTIEKLIDSLDCAAPEEIPEDASLLYEFAVEQARDMCSLEKRLAKIILEKLPELSSRQPRSLPVRQELVPSGDPFIDAMHWTINGGAKIDAVQIVSYGGSHRGLVVKHDIASGVPVMTVPLSRCITSIAARRTALAQEALRNNVSLTTHALMAAMLIQESRNPNSHLHYFLATFPASFDNLPIYYTEEELSLLKATRTLAFFKPYANEIDIDYELVQKAAPIAFASVTFEEYRRARHIVDTRNFVFQVTGQEEHEHIMVPYVDMMNHDLEPNTIWKFDPDTATFVVAAYQAISAGQALITSYGEKGNGQLLIGYGFALPNNPFDKATLRLDSNSMCVVQKTFNTVHMADCFLKLRKRFYDEVELLQKMKSGAINGLERFEQTIEEDQEVLAALMTKQDSVNQGNDRVKFCILTRLGEKMVLKFWIETADKLLQYYAGQVQRDELDPMFEQYFKVLEHPEQYGSEVRGQPQGENSENYVDFE